jgi:hypothetical protein
MATYWQEIEWSNRQKYKYVIGRKREEIRWCNFRYLSSLFKTKKRGCQVCQHPRLHHQFVFNILLLGR